MDQSQLTILKSTINIAGEHILREYFEMIILQAFSESNLTKNMIFYGGTALRLAYNGPRFSEDLDFLMIKKIYPKKLRELLHATCQKHSDLQLVEVKEKRNTLFALVKIRHNSLKHPRHIKIEISKKKNGIQSEYRLLSSPCSNFSPLIQTITLESLENLKKAAMTQRNEPRDWLDFLVIENLLKKPFVMPWKLPFDEKEFSRELKRFLPRNHWPLIEQLTNSNS